jgi:hypothetical protein
MWQEVIRELIAKRANESGVSIFRATAELDRGPVIAYCRYPIRDAQLEPLWREVDGASPEKLEDTALFQAIRERGAARESPLTIATMGAFADGRLRFEHGSVGGADMPLDLTDHVERELGLASRA